MTDYPDERNCDNCGMTIFVFFSKGKQKEYARNSMKHVNYQDGEKPDFHQCRNWKGQPVVKPIEKIEQDVREVKVKPKPKPITQKETIEEYLEPKLTPADQVTQVKGKVVEITTSRTVSYKYGVSAEYATEKEEIFESFTYGTKTEVDISQGNHALENTSLLAINDVNGVIHDQFTKHLNYRKIKQTGLLRK